MVAVFFLDSIPSRLSPVMEKDVSMPIQHPNSDNLSVNNTAKHDLNPAPPIPSSRQSATGSRVDQLRSVDTPDDTGAAFQSIPLSKRAASNFVAIEHDVDRATYDPYIAEDLRDRIFVFPEGFLTRILHLPSDWRTAYQTEMEKVRGSKTSKRLLKTYIHTCDSTQDEKMLCHPFNKAWSTGTQALCDKKGKNDKASQPSRLDLYRQDSQQVLDGKPRRVLILWGCLNPSLKVRETRSGVSRTMVLAIASRGLRRSIGLSLNYIRGCYIKALDVSIAYSQKKKPSSGSTQARGSSKYSRVASTPHISVAKAKYLKEAEEKQSIAMKQAAADSNERKKVRLQCAHYALEMLSSAGFRTHCIGALIASKQMQPLYYDRSSIVVCKDFHIVNGSGDTTDFVIGTIIGFSKLTERQRGIQRSLYDDSAMIKDYKTYITRCGGDSKTLFQGVKLNLTVSEDGTKVVLTLGRIISRQPGIIGRDTCVVEATASEYEPWKEKKLAVKIRWPAATRISEAEFVTKARKMAREMPQSLVDGAQSDWALDHLPDIIHSQDFGFDTDSPQVALRELFLTAKWANDQTFLHKDRVCRVTVQERLHRDISMGNIMWGRNLAGIICGVLVDDDLASYRDESGATSRHRTGTRPYMAFELLKNDKEGRPPKHLYRHDLESILYSILVLSRCHELDGTLPEGESQLVRVVCPKLDEWVHLPYCKLQSEKEHFFFTSDPQIEPTASFEGFGPWLEGLYDIFGTGFEAQLAFYNLSRRATAAAQAAPAPATVDAFFPITINRVRPQAPPPFNHNTLAGNVDYLRFLNACRLFGGVSLRLRNNQLILEEES
ncbi:hypothetical protein DFS33DRAFT_1450914 [Desarmillaria ectypa]|nr:hypothetical protein DFS33DRAFT_1450914 [Desarmillaria ectypa]